MRKSFIENVIYNELYEILVLIIPLVTTPYVSRVLNATAIGDYSYTNGIVSYFGIIATLGTANYASREIAFRQKDNIERSRVFYEIFSLRLLLTIIVSCFYIAFICFNPSKYFSLYIIQFLLFISWVLDISWLYRGIEDFKFITVRRTGAKLLGTLGVFLFVKTPQDLWKYALILTLSTVVGNATSWIGIKKYVQRIKIHHISPLSHIKGSLEFFVATVAVQIYTILDQTMLGYIQNTTEVGYYSQAQKIIKLCLTVISSFVMVLLPRISSLYKEQNYKEMNRYFRISLDYLFAIAMPLMIGCLLCADQFVPLFYGNGYDKVSVLMKMLSILFIVLGLGQLAGSLLSAIDKQMKSALATIIGAIFNFSLNLVLIKSLSSVGAVISSVLAEVLVTFIEIYYLRISFDVSYIIQAFKRYTVPTGIMGFIVFCLTRLEFGNPLMHLLVEVVVGVVVYVGFLLLKKDIIVKEAFNRIIKK